MLNIVPRKGLK